MEGTHRIHGDVDIYNTLSLFIMLYNKTTPRNLEGTYYIRSVKNDQKKYRKRSLERDSG